MKAKDDARWTALKERVRFNEKAYSEFFKRLEQVTKDADSALKNGDAGAALKSSVEALRRIKATKFSVSADFEAAAEYGRACALALTGRKAPALEAFARALELGFCEWDRIAQEAAFESIKSEESFQKAVSDGMLREQEALHALVASAHASSAKGDSTAELAAWQHVFARLERRRTKRGLDATDLQGWWFEYACCLAANAKKDDALKALSIAIASGFRDKKRLDDSKAFLAWKDDAAFAAVIAPLVPPPEKPPAPQGEKVEEPPAKPEKPDDASAPASLEAAQVKEALAKEPLFALDLDAAKTLKGDAFKLDAVRGSVLLVVSFHSAPPQAVGRLLDAWREKGLAVLGVIPGPKAEAEQIFADAAATQRIDYPVVSIEKGLPCSDDPLRTVLVFCDREGKPRVQKGEDSEDALTALLKALLEATDKK